ncbi:hypothetical protein [Tritonibacter sp. SIMBA_163]|uniref:hypothetical protein n=1 Tax=Tritonibacter sp. SIMBA_163 TaxID=3080868 RepID=UPI0039811254
MSYGDTDAALRGAEVPRGFARAAPLPVGTGFIDLHVGGVFPPKVLGRDTVRAVDQQLRDLDALLARCGVTSGLIAVTLDKPKHVPCQQRHRDLLVGCIKRLMDQGELPCVGGVHLRCELSDAGVSALLNRELDAHGDIVKLVTAMDHSPDQGQYKEPRQWRKAFAYLTFEPGYGLDDLAVARAEHARSAFIRDLEGLAKAATGRGIAFGLHDPECPERLDCAHALGARLCEFPITLEIARKAHDLGQTVLVGAPNVQRGGSKFGNVSANALLELGLVDAISLDTDPRALQPAWSHVETTYGRDRAARLFTSGPATLLAVLGADTAQSLIQALR